MIALPDTARGDLTIYDSRKPISFIRSAAGGYAYGVHGQPVGT